MWIALSLLAALIWSCVNVVDKHVISKYNLKPIVFVTVLSSLGLVVGLTLLVVLKIQLSPLLIVGLAVGATYPIVNLLYFKAINIEEVSRVIPWFAFSPLLVVVGAGLFLNEILFLRQYIGIGILLSGLFLITIKRGFTIRFGQWMTFMFLASLLTAVQLIIEKYLLTDVNPLHLFIFIEIGAFLGVIPFLIVNWETVKAAIINQTKSLKIILINETANISATFIMLMAISIGFVSLVSVMGSMQFLFLLLLTILISLLYPKILKEELAGSIIGLKVIAMILIIFGIYLIT